MREVETYDGYVQRERTYLRHYSYRAQDAARDVGTDENGRKRRRVRRRCTACARNVEGSIVVVVAHPMIYDEPLSSTRLSLSSLFAVSEPLTNFTLLVPSPDLLLTSTRPWFISASRAWKVSCERYLRSARNIDLYYCEVDESSMREARVSSDIEFNLIHSLFLLARDQDQRKSKLKYD